MAIDELPTLRAAKDAAKAAVEAKRRELLAVPEYVALTAEAKRTMDELDAAARKGRYFRYAVVEDGGWCTIFKSEHDSAESAKAALRELKKAAL